MFGGYTFYTLNEKTSIASRPAEVHMDKETT